MTGALKAAFQVWEHTASQTNVPPSSSAPPAAIDGPYTLTFGKHAGKRLEEVPDDYIAWLKAGEMINTNAALKAAVQEWDTIPRVYHLCFGKYKGRTLDEVPPTYLNWLHDFGAEEGHDDLRQALKAQKEQNAALQVSSVQNSSTGPKGRKKKPFKVPSATTLDYRRYYYHGDKRGGQMWIGCNDCVRYFGADPKAMAAAGLHPFQRGQRFWVHQVFAYAKYFGTTKNETPTQALNKFKAKNHRKDGTSLPPRRPHQWGTGEVPELP
ncbi:Uu.00g039840.m01.CDS01 [Anthostomella pinea]|uniref:Uu.00g039840.m01.CDS01 n=1 Tax=Anthostomella pinea TaxID=933095 RepID=A0AAI8VB43_9PEZI|nr:Uu.00g039840.m01.CDS01 [Anthostomella pinea]